MYKSYLEIRSDCTLFDFTDDSSGIREIYYDDTYRYECYWFPSSMNELPATIYITKEIDD